MTEEQTQGQPETRPSEVHSDALLAAWHEYTGNKYSMHPCENFKAGWRAAMKAANNNFAGPRNEVRQDDSL